MPDSTRPPLVLIHSINAAGSSAEVRPLTKALAASRRTIAFDLPGFGLSNRDDIEYTPRLMTEAITATVSAAAREHAGPVDALAVSLSCEFLARSASENPHLFRSLALVSPTGFSGRRAYRQPAGTTRGKPWLYKALTGPGWGPSLYRQLTRPGVIRYFLEKTWGSKAIDEDLLATDIELARLPGAHHAPLYFLSGGLFSADIHTVYDSLTMPVWMSHGTRGDFVDYRQLPAFAERHRWPVSVFKTGALPYFEDLAGFLAAYDRFLSAQFSPATTNA